MKTPLCSYAHLAFLVNSLLDRRIEPELTFKEVHAAAHEGRLIALLDEWYGPHGANAANFSGLYMRCVNLEQMEAALSQAALALEGREWRSARVQHRGLSLVMAILLEAMQQEFDEFPTPPDEPEEDPEWWKSD